MVRNLTIPEGASMMREARLQELHTLFLEFKPLFHQKFGATFQRDDQLQPQCNKSQNRALFTIAHAGRITASDLGKCLEMQKGSLTTLVDSLETMGLVQREPDLQDRRKMWISLTPAGSQYLELKKQLHAQRFKQLFTDMTDAELAEFAAVLRQLIKLMGQLKGE